VSLLQLLDQGLHVGRDCFFRGLLLLRLVGVLGGRVDGVRAVNDYGLQGCFSFVFALEWSCCCCSHNNALAQAHACGGSNCKGRGISQGLERSAAQCGRLGIPLRARAGRAP
jgi:hypothetical protein